MSTLPVGPSRLGTALHALKFVLAGNATFTLRSVKTGTRFTYRVSRVCCNDCKRDYAGRKVQGCAKCSCHDAGKASRYFVGILSGPDNESDYRYLGMLSTGENGVALSTTRNSKIDTSAPSAVAIAWFLSKVQAGTLPEDVEVWHAGSCGKCGRKLTVPESIALGIGPECALKGGF